MALKLATKRLTYKVDYCGDDGIHGEVVATFFGCPLTPTEISAIIEKYKIVTWEAPDKRSQKQRIEDYKGVDVMRERFVKTVHSWEGVTDRDGNPIECTDETKSLVYEFNQEICKFVLDKFDEIAKYEATKREDDLLD